MTEIAARERPIGVPEGGPPGEPGKRGAGGTNRLWNRSLDHYPNTGPRMMYLGIVVLSAIVLYYQYYVQAAVTPSVIAHFHLSFRGFTWLIIVVGNAVGAFGSLAAGLADRWGRANLIIYGILVSALIVLVGMPNVPYFWAYAVLYALLGVVEGIALVAIPAVLRDFSPQMGRASAMGFYTMGPVIGSLIVAQVASRTLHADTAWQTQFHYSGWVGLGMFVVALVGLRELSPGLRDQVMVSMKDRALVEARASGIDIEASLRHPWRQMLHREVIGASIGIAVFLIVYYTIVAFLVTYMQSVFSYSEQRANGLGNWMWAFNAGALVVVGFLSDRLRVRKPFMLIGAVGTIAATTLFALRTDQPDTGYYHFVWIVSLLAIFLGFVFTPWLASFTETVERRNPALIATGLAVFGWVLRAGVSISLFILPFVVTSATPLTDPGLQVQSIIRQYPAEVATLQAIDTTTAARLQANPSDVAAIGTAVTEISRTFNVTPAVAVQRLVAVSKVPPADLTFLAENGPKVKAAQATAPGEWRRWWWICVGTEAIFIPFIFLLTGRWNPRKAREDEEAHERQVAEELAKLAAARAPAATPAA